MVITALARAAAVQESRQFSRSRARLLYVSLGLLTLAKSFACGILRRAFVEVFILERDFSCGQLRVTRIILIFKNRTGSKFFESENGGRSWIYHFSGIKMFALME